MFEYILIKQKPNIYLNKNLNFCHLIFGNHICVYPCTYVYTYDLILQHSMGGKILFLTENMRGGEGVRTYFNIGLSFSTHNLNLFPIKNWVLVPNSNGLIAWQRVNLWYFLNLIYSRIHIFKFQMSTHWVAKIWDWKIRVCGKYSVSLSRLFRNWLS